MSKKLSIPIKIDHPRPLTGMCLQSPSKFSMKDVKNKPKPIPLTLNGVKMTIIQITHDLGYIDKVSVSKKRKKRAK